MSSLLPDVTCTIDGVAVDIADWSCNSAANIGHDQMRGKAPAAQLRRIGSLGQGSEIALHANGAEHPIFAGRLSTEPRYIEGVGEITARGYGYDIVKRTARRLYMSGDYSAWQAADSEELTGGSRYKAIQTDTSGGRLGWKLSNGQSYGAGANNRAGFAFYAEGQQINKITFTLGKSDNNVDLEFQLLEGDGPTSAGTESITYGLGAGGDADATAESHTFDTGTYDLIFFYLHATAAANSPLTSGANYTARNVRVYGNGTTGATPPSAVMADIASDMGFDSGGVTTSTVLSDLLPLDWTDGSWADLLTYVADLEDWRWRVLDDRGNGPYLEYGPYSSRTWTTYADVCIPSLTPIERFNQVEVKYLSHSGAELKTTVTADPDPLADKSLTNVYEYELQDTQGDATLATTLATNLVERLSAQRYSGTIEIGRAWDERGKDAPREILAGDTLRIADFSDAMAVEMRITDVEQTPEGVRVSLEDYLPIEAMLADVISLLVPEHKKKKRRRHRRNKR